MSLILISVYFDGATVKAIQYLGYGVAVVTQILIFPMFGLHTTLVQNLKMGGIFTIVSIARSFALRRIFEAIRVRGAR